MPRAFAPVALLFAAALGGATFLPAPAGAETATLVRDLALPATNPFRFAASPLAFAALGDRLVFSANTPGAGRELWASDGTAAGTELLADLCESSCSSNPEILGQAGGVLFFVASIENRNEQDLLFRTDGTRRGTFALTADGRPITIFRPSQRSGAGSGFAVASGRLYFSQLGGLWASDGTAKGTVEVKDLGSEFAGPREIVAVGGRVFLSATGSSPGSIALWASDGTAAGTRLLHELASSSDLFRLTPAASRLYFVAGPQGDRELWTSDGTAAGTRAVSSFAAPSPIGFDQELKTVGDQVYFAADDVLHGSELWTSDGTPGGTRRLTDFGFDQPFGGLLAASGIGVLGSHVVFRATDGLHPAQLWVTSGGTDRGTPGSMGPLAAVTPVSGFFPVGNRLLFLAQEAAHGTEIWTTDGTPAGTGLLADLCPGACGSTAVGFVPFAGGALFASDVPFPALWRTDGTPGGTRRFAAATLGTPDRLSFFNFAVVGAQVFYFTYSSTAGSQLWVNDGTRGTRLVTAFALDGPGSAPASFAALGGQLFFVASDASGRSQLWRTAGNPESTFPVLPTGRSSPLSPDGGKLVPTAGLLFFTRQESGVLELWRTDGTADGTFGFPLPGNLGTFTGSLPQLAAYRGKLLFYLLRNGTPELWQSDGTPAGTTQAFPLPAGLHSVDGLTALGDELYFQGTDESGVAVWKSDGTTAGTHSIASSLRLSFTPSFTRVGPLVFFLGGDIFPQVYRTDGTPAGTFPVTGPGVSDAADITAYNGALYFFADADAGARALWRSDGTVKGTVPVVKFHPFFGEDSSSPAPASPIAFAGRLFFSADDGGNGRELWSSDGTAAGTALVRDLFPGPPGARPAELTVAGGRLFFTAEDSVHGRELWSTDGTAAGTRLVQDVAPGATAASPTQLTVAGGRLYFAADDGLSGRELWSLPLAGPAGCQPGDTRLCLAGDRFQVEIAWRDFQGNTGVGHAVSLTADTGYFWFFSPSNVETVVKVLDARALNGAFWVFYGALSSVEYEMTVTDTQTGLTRRYGNPAGQLASVGDTDGFGPLGAYDSKLVSARTDPRAASGTCTPGPRRLCLNGGRFAVESSWKDFQGKTGTGTAVPLTADTGYFWFFAPTNVEVMTKVLDGRGLNGKFWFFYGALSNVEYTLTVTDTQTGAVKTYKNPSGQFGSVADTGAF